MMISVFVGDNSYTIARAVNELTRQFKGSVERFDGGVLESGQLADIFTGLTLFAEERLIVITGASTNKTIWTDIEPWVERVPETTHLVFVEPHPDKRTKTYKQLVKQARVYEHALLDTPALVNWLQAEARDNGVDVSRADAHYLVGYVGHDQWRLKSELQKLLLCGQPIDRDQIHRITEPYPEATAFELLDSVFSGKLDRAEELIDLLAQREDPHQFTGLLSSQLLGLLAVAAGGERRPDEVARDIGIHPYVVQKLRPVANRIGKRNIETAIEKLAYCDLRSKTSGGDPWDQLRRTMLTLVV